MNGILGMAYLVRRSGVAPHQANQLDKIAASAGHPLRIINDVLDLAKVEAGKIVRMETDFALEEFLHAVTDVIGNGIKEKELSLHTDMAGMPEWLHGGTTRLQQALLNYLGNAVKFTEHGSITLEGRLLEEAAAGYLVRFAVCDTGRGLSVRQIGELFAPFHQVDESLTRACGGTGLGLEIVKRIAGLMGVRPNSKVRVIEVATACGFRRPGACRAPCPRPRARRCRAPARWRGRDARCRNLAGA
jgi:two-component system, sensor histidine kinase and response regulator